MRAAYDRGRGGVLFCPILFMTSAAPFIIASTIASEELPKQYRRDAICIFQYYAVVDIVHEIVHTFFLNT